MNSVMSDGVDFKPPFVGRRGIMPWLILLYDSMTDILQKATERQLLT